MKKIKSVAAILAAVICGASLASFAACAYVDEDDGHEFTVLTVKEETVKDYNTMPVFTECSVRLQKCRAKTFIGLITRQCSIRIIQTLSE